MAKGKSAYYGPYEQGIGTILRDTERGFFDYALQVPSVRMKRQQQAAKQADDIYKQLKPGDAWRRFQPTITKEWNALSDDVARSLASGTFSRASLSKRIAQLKSLEEMSTQLQGETETVVKQYMGDERVKDSAIQELENRIAGDGSVQQLYKAAASPLKSDFFLVERGGSKHINKDAAMNEVLKNNFNDWIQTELQTRGEMLSTRFPGLVEWDENTQKAKIKRFLTRDANGNVQVANVDQLMQMGVLDIFENDPYMNRVLEDAAAEEAQLAGRKMPNANDKALSLRRLLKGREVGQIANEQTRRTSRYSVDFQGRRDREVQQDAMQWLRDFRQGNKEALDFTIGGKIFGDEVTGQGPAAFRDVGVFAGLPSVQLRTGTDDEGRPTYETVVVDPETMTDEEALRLYNVASKARKTKYQEFSVDDLDQLGQQIQTLDDIE